MNKIYLSLWLCLLSVELLAQDAPSDSTHVPWNFSAWAEVFVIPDQSDVFNPTFYARHGNLHLEGRYNYEDMNTASFWAGRRFKFGESVKFVLVPMAAVVVGNTQGMAPGLEMEIMYKKLDFYSESEHVFDFHTKENNFFYMYSELAIRPVRPVRTGMIMQRTKLFESDRELQRGIFGEYYFNQFRGGLFYFNPFDDDQFWIVSFSVDF